MNNEGMLLKQSQSSLPLQVLIHFNWHYVAFFFLLNLALFAYKCTFLFGYRTVPCLLCSCFQSSCDCGELCSSTMYDV